MSVVPVIDISPARRDAAGRRAVADAIGAANESVGFLVIAGHGVPGELIDDMYRVTAEFFALPYEEKLAVRCVRPEESRGYMPPKSRALAYSRGERTPADLVEFFAAGLPEVPEDDPYYKPENAGVNFRPNVWPERPAHFAEVWTRYYRAMEGLAQELMRLFALALDLDEHYFDDKIDKHCSNLFANHYPPLETPPEPGQLRLGAHTDYGSLTLLHQDDAAGGLQVFKDGEWHDVAAIPGTFIVNIGDLMARWTNDRWVSTLHRVQNPPLHDPASRRISIPFFCQPNYDALIEALPTCVSPENPAKYPPITSGRNMTEKTDRSFAVSAAG